jgi:hypothetical protein
MDRRTLFRRLVLSLVAATGVVLVAVGFNSVEEREDRPTVLNAAVRSVVPADGSLDLRQGVIGFTLDVRYQGRLVVDGVPIPDDQVQFAPGVNSWTYRPGPGTETGALRPGRHVARVYYWERGRSEDPRQFVEWSFSSH